VCATPLDPGDPLEPAGPAEPAEATEPAGSAGPAGPAEPAEPAEPAGPRRRWFDRIGIITGSVLFVLAVVGLIILAVVGFSPATYLLVLLAVGLFLIIQGTRSRGPHRSS
jgi:hypothetical protein